MAKKALIEKNKRKPKYKVRAYTRCEKCGRPAPCIASSACVASACANSRTPVRSRA